MPLIFLGGLLVVIVLAVGSSHARELARPLVIPIPVPIPVPAPVPQGPFYVAPEQAPSSPLTPIGPEPAWQPLQPTELVPVTRTPPSMRWIG